MCNFKVETLTETLENLALNVKMKQTKINTSINTPNTTHWKMRKDEEVLNLFNNSIITV